MRELIENLLLRELIENLLLTLFTVFALLFMGFSVGADIGFEIAIEAEAALQGEKD